jgi:tRNA-2-methylthio-N6-dimethylallyladenosine synthase
VKDCPHVAKDFHLPLQAGDDEILKMMNRGYTIDYFRGRVKKIKELMPEATITTDIIVGFPGETEEQFNNTLDRVREFKFNAVNMSAYSLRPQTAAAELPGHLTEEIKQERLRRLKEVVHEVAGKRVAQQVNG